MNSANENYVSRGALKLEGAAHDFGLDFRGKTVLDVGSSTGGFTDFALRHGAAKVIAVDSGTNQLHPSLRENPKIELHEKTDIRDFKTDENIDLVLADASFISLRLILPAIAGLSSRDTYIAALVKPQFEAQPEDLNKGVVKNDTIRRRILKDFEHWSKKYFVIKSKSDSPISGSKGNQERFYLLKKI